MISYVTIEYSMGIRTGWQGLFCLEVWGQNRVILTRVTFHSTARVTTFLRCGLTFFSSVKFSPSVVFDSLWPHGLQHIRLPCPSPNPRACSNSCPSHRWCHPTISPSIIPHLQSFQNQGLFPWVGSSHQMAKVLEFQLQHQSFHWIFRTDFL